MTRTAAVFFALSAPAGAATPADVDRALGVANGVYPTACVPVVEEAPLYNANADAEAYEQDCRIRLRPDFRVATDYARLCSVMIHEKGHLAGFREAGGSWGGKHSTDPANVMYDGSPHQAVCGMSAAQRLELEGQADRLRVQAAELRERAYELRVEAAALRRVRPRSVRRTRHVRHMVRRARTLSTRAHALTVRAGALEAEAGRP